MTVVLVFSRRRVVGFGGFGVGGGGGGAGCFLAGGVGGASACFLAGGGVYECGRARLREPRSLTTGVSNILVGGEAGC